MSEVAELSIDPVSRQELAAFPLIADTQFYEAMGSESFNRKLTGIVPPGIYRGFDFAITGADKITVCTGDKNTAAVERDGQMITVQGQHPIEISIPRGAEVAVIVEAISQYGLLTSQIDKNSAVPAAQLRVVPISDIAPHQLIVLTVNLPAVVALDDDHISTERRTVGGLNNTPTFEQLSEILATRLRTEGNVGSSALLDVMASLTDLVTPNALMPRGAFGVGIPIYAQNINFNDPKYCSHSTSFYIASSASSPGGVDGWLDVKFISPGNCRQIFHTVGNRDTIVRSQIGGVWGAWSTQYHFGNIVGLVSQMGGAPTGAIIEYGQNANGSYLKLAGGILICWTSNAPQSALTSTSTGGGNLFRTHLLNWSFPMHFASVLPCVFGLSPNNLGYISPVNRFLTYCEYYSVAPNNGVSSANTQLFAIGTWY